MVLLCLVAAKRRDSRVLTGRSRVGVLFRPKALELPLESLGRSGIELLFNKREAEVTSATKL
jgi:hypothetical protein